MRVISVDLGLARTGIAAGDTDFFLASPVTVINEYNEEKLIDKICQTAKAENAEKIVVGLPRNMDGSEGERALKCREIAQKISEKSGIPIVMQDERCTTVSAHNALKVNNVRGKKRKGVVDAVAATIILEDYFRSIK